jgi:hypothetical protein
VTRPVQAQSEGVLEYVSESAIEGEGYVSWMQEESMLADAGTIAGQFSGIGDV